MKETAKKSMRSTSTQGEHSWQRARTSGEIQAFIARLHQALPAAITVAE